jgi:radical SAM protein with 4Fe4S-binding SPASM domain
MNWNSVLRLTNGFFNGMKPNSSPVPPGIHKFDRNTPEEKCRIHLRIDPDGSGTLLINAAQIYHLNPTAALMSFLFLSKKSDSEAVSRLAQVFRIPANQARQDYSDFLPTLYALLHPEEACPICDLDLDANTPFSTRPTAPYRMDLALTYRCNNNCAHCYNARPRNFPEMTTNQWKQVIKQCWDLGIPHIIFTGGEPTLRNDLAELIAFAESQGQITGLNTNGRRLANKEFLKTLIDAGLDHVQITFESADPSIHDRLVSHPGAWNETKAGIRNAVDSRLFVMTNTTLLQENARRMADTLNLLGELKVPTIGLNALIYSGRGETVGTGLPESALTELLDNARQITTANHQKLIWYTPTQYCHFDPMTLQLGIKGCTAALYNMCIEPDGAVLPCQSYYQPVGNILKNSWDSIWNHELSFSLRERINVPAGCTECSLLQECGGGCPLHQLESQPVPFLKEIAY